MGERDKDEDHGGGPPPTQQSALTEEKANISDVVLAFIHSWFQGNNHQEIVKLCLASFSVTQLAEATKLLIEKFPESGKFIAHRDTAGRPASEMFSADILKVFQFLDTKGISAQFSCDSISMRSVKVSTMLFSDEEPIIAHKMAIMEKSISELLESQKTLFALLSEKLQEPSKANPEAALKPGVTPTPVIPSVPSDHPLSFAETAARAVSGNIGIRRNPSGQAKAKRINSVVEDDTATDETDDDVWEVSAEEKRREKLRKRIQEKKKQEDLERRRGEERRKPKFIVGTGSRIDDRDSDCPGKAAPKHVFVARTAMSTTKETVEGCLEYLSGIKGEATCCTPQDRIKSGEAFSLSWRVQVESGDLEKALLPSSWKSGWAVKPYYFRRKKPDNQTSGAGQNSDSFMRFLAPAGQSGHLRQNSQP